VNRAVLFSSASDEWETPQDLFDRLDDEFTLWIDVAATHKNKKRPDYFGPNSPISSDGLLANWAQFGSLSRCWCNPPYSRGLQAKFIAKAAEERRKGVLTVMLLPARTDTKAFHTHIYDAECWQARPGVEIRFLPGRLKFGGAENSAPFPSMIVVFRP
jgi:site-specific DNA-methyltransferase (adenine-specific)